MGVSTATATAVVLDQRGHSSSRSIWQQLAGWFGPPYTPPFFEGEKMGKKIVSLADLQSDLKRDELPAELLAELSSTTRNNGLSNKIMNWAQEHGKAFCIDDVLIALYELDGSVNTRASVSNRLHRLTKMGRLIRVGVGTYQANQQHP